ncbi:extracellular solute-binding protein, partial [Rubrobacter taiwanensis]
PTTWDELQEVARQVAEQSGTRFGFVFQGAEYEGGVVNGLEYIWTHGGDALDPQDPSVVTIGSQEAIAGLTTERSMVEEGVSPEAVSTYQEMDAHTAFLNGDAVFMRNWPYVYGLLADPETSSISPEQVGIAPLPVASPGDQSSSCAGGWNLFINAASPNPDAAWTLIEYLAAPEQQKERSLEGGYLPTLAGLYEDREIVDNVPVIALGREAIQNVRSRPVSPYYSDMSLVLAAEFNASLRGAKSPEEAARTGQSELERIIEQGSA